MFFLFLLLTPLASATELSFDELWRQVQTNSQSLQAAQHEVHAGQLAVERAARHWLPRLTLTGQWFRTDDPTQIFFQNLGQRAIQQADFAPAQLNRPPSQDFRFSSLNLDFPLYEGGLKSAQLSLFTAMRAAAQLDAEARRSEDYVNLATRFGELLVAQDASAQLDELSAALRKVIASYQVGAKANPVGHSGLLGLRGVGLRIEALHLRARHHQKTAQDWMREKATLPSDWRPRLQGGLNGFLLEHLNESSPRESSSRLAAQRLRAQTLQELEKMESARLKPRLGLFAQGQHYEGARDTATATALGVYLAWDLFNPDSLGRAAEVRARRAAADAQLLAHGQDERLAVDKLLDARRTLQSGLRILEDSQALLEEQSRVAFRLFSAGLVSALQLAEVINRRVDLIEKRGETQLQFLEINGQLYLLKH